MAIGILRPSLQELSAGIRAQDRASVARAITLVESSNPDHRKDARLLIQDLLGAGDSRNAHRIGITGVPGVGKSTLIDQLGTDLVSKGHRVAVLAVDPTSQRTGGSILGDKTRMNRLSSLKQSFIRPSPTSGTLGGVTRRTRESMIVVEAAGFDIVIVETVGVGQSETAVASMVDFFLVMLLPGGGDELQGIKKGVIEIADMLVVNKADGDNAARAQQTAADYRSALALLQPHSETWHAPVLAVSGLTNVGLDQIWRMIATHHCRLSESGELQTRRAEQAVRWMREMLMERLMERISNRPDVAALISETETLVRESRLAPSVAVDRILLAL